RSIDVTPNDELVVCVRFPNYTGEALEREAGVPLLAGRVVRQADAGINDAERACVARALEALAVESKLDDLLAAVVGIPRVEILGPTHGESRPSCLGEVYGGQLAPTGAGPQPLPELRHPGLQRPLSGFPLLALPLLPATPFGLRPLPCLESERDVEGGRDARDLVDRGRSVQIGLEDRFFGPQRHLLALVDERAPLVHAPGADAHKAPQARLPDLHPPGQGDEPRGAG